MSSLYTLPGQKYPMGIFSILCKIQYNNYTNFLYHFVALLFANLHVKFEVFSFLERRIIKQKTIAIKINFADFFGSKQLVYFSTELAIRYSKYMPQAVLACS